VNTRGYVLSLLKCALCYVVGAGAPLRLVRAKAMPATTITTTTTAIARSSELEIPPPLVPLVVPDVVVVEAGAVEICVAIDDVVVGGGDVPDVVEDDEVGVSPARAMLFRVFGRMTMSLGQLLHRRVLYAQTESP
jgi:hypothetical protein